MDDRSWMYRDSPQGLRRMDYCNGVQGFINFTTSISINFSDGMIDGFKPGSLYSYMAHSPAESPTERVHW